MEMNLRSFSKANFPAPASEGGGECKRGNGRGALCTFSGGSLASSLQGREREEMHSARPQRLPFCSQMQPTYRDAPPRGLRTHELRARAGLPQAPPSSALAKANRRRDRSPSHRLTFVGEAKRSSTLDALSLFAPPQN